MAEPTTAPAIEPEGLPLVDAAALIGVSESAFKQLDRDNQLPAACLRIGRIVRWSRRELVAWLLAGCPTRPRWEAVRERELRRCA